MILLVASCSAACEAFADIWSPTLRGKKAVLPALIAKVLVGCFAQSSWIRIVVELEPQDILMWRVCS